MDFLICQTVAASPAEPGELPVWFSSSVKSGNNLSVRIRYVEVDTNWMVRSSRFLLEGSFRHRSGSGYQVEASISSRILLEE